MIVLASSSPRRKDILDKSNLEYKIITKDIEEIFPDEGLVWEKISKVAYDKAKAVFDFNCNDIVIGADTAVVIGDEILGKPIDDNHALEMLLKLNNKKHSVITGVAILSKEKEIVFYEESIVTFKNNSIVELNEYIKTKEPVGKAGSYAIQGIGEKLVDSFTGDLENIIGLPLSRLLKELEQFNK